MQEKTKIRLGLIGLWGEFAAYFFIYAISTKNFFTLYDYLYIIVS